MQTHWRLREGKVYLWITVYVWWSQGHWTHSGNQAFDEEDEISCDSPVWLGHEVQGSGTILLAVRYSSYSCKWCWSGKIQRIIKGLWGLLPSATYYLAVSCMETLSTRVWWQAAEVSSVGQMGVRVSKSASRPLTREKRLCWAYNMPSNHSRPPNELWFLPIA